MQLRTHDGYRDLHCLACGHHARCGWHLCVCNVPWNQCETHRVDPILHKSTKPPKKAKVASAAEQGAEPTPKLSAKRTAPEAKAARITKARKGTGSAQSTNRPGCKRVHTFQNCAQKFKHIKLNRELHPKLFSRFCLSKNGVGANEGSVGTSDAQRDGGASKELEVKNCTGVPSPSPPLPPSPHFLDDVLDGHSDTHLANQAQTGLAHLAPVSVAIARSEAALLASGSAVSGALAGAVSAPRTDAPTGSERVPEAARSAPGYPQVLTGLAYLCPREGTIPGSCRPTGVAYLSPGRSPADDPVPHSSVAVSDFDTVRTAACTAPFQPVAAASAYLAAGQAGGGDGRPAVEISHARRRVRGKQTLIVRRCWRAPHPLSPGAAEIMGQGRRGDAGSADDDGEDADAQPHDSMSPGEAEISDRKCKLGQRCCDAPPPLGRLGAAPFQRCASAPHLLSPGEAEIAGGRLSREDAGSMTPLSPGVAETVEAGCDDPKPLSPGAAAIVVTGDGGTLEHNGTSSRHAPLSPGAAEIVVAGDGSTTNAGVEARRRASSEVSAGTVAVAVRNELGNSSTGTALHEHYPLSPGEAEIVAAPVHQWSESSQVALNRAAGKCRVERVENSSGAGGRHRKSAKIDVHQMQVYGRMTIDTRESVAVARRPVDTDERRSEGNDARNKFKALVKLSTQEHCARRNFTEQLAKRGRMSGTTGSCLLSRHSAVELVPGAESCVGPLAQAPAGTPEATYQRMRPRSIAADLYPSTVHGGLGSSASNSRHGAGSNSCKPVLRFCSGICRFRPLSGG